MEIIERYLQAVRLYLPVNAAANPKNSTNNNDDIIRELKDSLLSQVEEIEAAQNRQLTNNEIGAILKTSGHPMVAAARYGQQKYLIGPRMYPFWWMSIRAMLVVFAAIYGALAGVALLSERSIVQAVLQGGNNFIHAAAFFGAIITLVFWGVERRNGTLSFIENWQPNALVASKPGFEISRFNSISELIATAVFTLWWLGAVNFPATYWHHGAPVGFSLSAGWQSFWSVILAVAIAEIVFAATNIVWPYWTKPRLILRVVLSAIAVVALIAPMHQAVLITLVGDGLAAKTEKISMILNHSMKVVLILAACVYAVNLVESIVRLVRLARLNRTSKPAEVLPS